eukprot:scaffold105658_cov65-Attheya_sp.AAC.2
MGYMYEGWLVDVFLLGRPIRGGKWVGGCILGVAFGGPGVVGNAGAMTRRMGYEYRARLAGVFRLGSPIGGRGRVGGCGLGVEFGGPAGAVRAVWVPLPGLQCLEGFIVER